MSDDDATGAEILTRTLVRAGVDVCFSNPGTSEMHFVAALDKVDGIRSVLCLFEGVASGAADGFFRLARRPAATLLHLGPGFGNAVANLHNAKKARSGMINIVGEHATYHRQFDAPLTSDIETLAGPMSDWVKMATSSTEIGQDAAQAIEASWQGHGRIATLILPADVSWGTGGATGEPRRPSRAGGLSSEDVKAAALALGRGRGAILLGGSALRGGALRAAGKIAARCGCKLLAEANNARHERGAGRTPVERLPIVVGEATAKLSEFDSLVLVGAKAPVAFFAYPGQPSILTREEIAIVTLADVDGDALQALTELCDAVGASSSIPLQSGFRIARVDQTGPISPSGIEAALAAAMPEDAIVVDESITTGRAFSSAIQCAAPHDWLQSMGASLGYALPVALGAAIAAPDRKVIALVGDGSAAYTPQALWSLGREQLNVTVLIFANRSYQVLKGELARVGAGNPGRKALDMLSLDRPTLDWVRLAEGFGIEACRASDLPTLLQSLQRGVRKNCPYLIEVVMP